MASGRPLGDLRYGEVLVEPAAAHLLPLRLRVIIVDDSCNRADPRMNAGTLYWPPANDEGSG